MSHLKSSLEDARKRNTELEEKVEEGLKKVRDSREEQANIEERLRKELVSQVKEMDWREGCVLCFIIQSLTSVLVRMDTALMA